MTDLPIVTLAGKSYSVALLVPRQQRIIIPALMRKAKLSEDISAMKTEDYDDILRIVYWGVIEPNDKEFKYEQIYDLPVTVAELMEAVKAVQIQSGMFKPAGDSGPLPIPAVTQNP